LLLDSINTLYPFQWEKSTLKINPY
jgi:hypothetical protein